MTIAATSPSASASSGRRLLEREEQVAAALDPQRGRGPRRSSTAVFRRSRSAGVELLDHWVLHPDQRHPAVGGHRLGSSSRPGAGPRGRSGPASGPPRLPRRTASAASLAGRQHDVGGQPCLRRSRAGEELGRRWESSPGAPNGSSRCLPKARGRRHHEHSDHEPGSDHHEGAAGGEPAQPVQYLRHGGSPSTVARSARWTVWLHRRRARVSGASAPKLAWCRAYRPGRVSLSAGTGPRAGP